MRAFIENQLYRPGIVLPLLGLTHVLVSTDFSLGQTGLVIAVRGTQKIWCGASRALRQALPQAASPARNVACGQTTHCHAH